jgi:DNA-binding GntR family transcriptional regulator
LSRQPRRTSPAGSTNPKSLVDLAHDELHRLITDGELAEGERIVIDWFAREFGISLIPIREALARLHAEGLVRFERNKGYRVAPRPTLEELARLFEARLVIELGAAELALERSTPEALRDLKAINRLIARGSYGTTFRAFREFITLNERFHVELVALAGNPPLSEAYARIGYHQQITRPTYGQGPGDVQRIVREHDAIIHALETRDLPALRDAVSTHIAGGLETFRNSQAAAKNGGRAGGTVNGAHDYQTLPARSAASRARTKAP